MPRLPAIATLCLVFVAGCTVPVAAGLEEAEANRVVVALDHEGIDATKEADPGIEGRFRVTVPHDDASRALVAMADEQLPRRASRGLLEVADRGQLVPSLAAEHAQLVAGLAGELERTLSNVEGVLAARVHLNLPVRDPLREGPPAKATASVLIEHRGTAPPLTSESVQRVVGFGAPGLLPSDVTVVFIAHAARASGARSNLAHVGPIAVARGSLTALRGAIAGLVLVVVILCAIALGLYAKLARLRRDSSGDRPGNARGGP